MRPTKAVGLLSNQSGPRPPIKSRCLTQNAVAAPFHAGDGTAVHGPEESPAHARVRFSMDSYTTKERRYCRPLSQGIANDGEKLGHVMSYARAQQTWSCCLNGGESRLALFRHNDGDHHHTDISTGHDVVVVEGVSSCHKIDLVFPRIKPRC
jgi:hypothetical protein